MAPKCKLIKAIDSASTTNYNYDDYNRLTNATSPAYKDVEVTLTSDTGSVHKIYSDQLGQYKITNIQPGKYELAARGVGFLPYKKKIELKSLDNEVFNIGLKPGSLDGTESMSEIITGVVTRSDKTPLPTATVVVISAFDQEIWIRFKPILMGYTKLMYLVISLLYTHLKLDMRLARQH